MGDQVEASDREKKIVDLLVLGGLQRGEEQRLENIVDDVLEILDAVQALLLQLLIVDRNLDDPAVLVALQLVVRDPRGQQAPLLLVRAAEGDPPLGEYVLLFFEVVELHFD